MSEKTVQQDKKKPVVDKKDSVGQKSPSADKGPSTSTAGILFNSIIILSIIMMGGFFWVNSQQAMNAQQKINNNEKEKIIQLEQIIDALKTSEARRSTALQEELSQLKEQQLKYQRLIEDIASVISDNRGAIHLQEAEYLIYVANQRLQFSRDVKGALAAMVQAGDILAKEKSNILLALRKQIADDILGLKSVDIVDVESIAIDLITIENRVTDLPLNKDIKTSSFKAKDSGFNLDGMGLSDWELILERVWSEFRKLLLIQHKDEVAAPMLMMEHEYLLRNNLQLKLEMARIALLNKQQALYRESIVTAIKWLELYFDMSDSGVSVIKDELSQVQGLLINPDLPDISKSLQLLRSQVMSKGSLVVEGAH